MILFLFVVGLILFVIVMGVGVVGNRIIGVFVLGGILFGIIFGVLVIFGFYYLFVKFEEGKLLIKNEDYVFFIEIYYYNDEVLSDDK